MDDVLQEDEAARAREDVLMRLAMDGDERNDQLVEDRAAAEADEPVRATIAPADVHAAACRWCREEFEDAVGEAAHVCQERIIAEASTFEAGQTLLRPAVHEFGAHALFSHPRDGLSPYFAVVKEWDQCLGEVEESDDQDDTPGTIVAQSDSIGTFEACGETWELNHEERKQKAWDGKIAMRESDVGERFREVQIGVRAVDDVGRKRITYQFRPSLPDARHVETGERIKSMPEDLPEGIRVQISSANVEPEETLTVLRALMDQMGIRRSYFADRKLQPNSRVYNLAVYARVRRAISESNLVNHDGLLDRLAELSSQRRGKGEYKWDNEEIVGHRNAVAMTPESLEKFYGEHTVGKLLKVYHMKHVEKQHSGAPTFHPKVEVQHSKRYSPYDVESVPWVADPDADEEDGEQFVLDDLLEELTGYLQNALHWAGLPTWADDTVYIEDAYWTPETDVVEEADSPLVSDPTDQLRETEEELVRAHYAREDATPGERAVLRSVTDGGRAMHYEELAAESGTSKSTVYRAIQRFDGLFTKLGDGRVDLADGVIRDKLTDLFVALEDRIEWIERGIRQLASDTALLEEDSALAKWARRHGAVLKEDYEGDLSVQLTGRHSEHKVRQLLRSGYMAARATGAQTADAFIDAAFSWTLRDGSTKVGQRPIVRETGVVKVLGSSVEFVP